MMPTSPLDPRPSSRDAAIMVTRRCNMSCGHCSVESGPGLKGEPSEQQLRHWVQEAARSGLRTLRFTGGEPMLRARVVLRLLRESRRLGMGTALTTNGFWGRSATSAQRYVRALRRAGLSTMTVSYDRYHAEFQNAEPVLHIARAAADAGLSVRINLVRGADETGLDAIVRQLEVLPDTRVRVYDLQPVGRARNLPPESHRAELEGFCTAAAFPAISDDGRVLACNGPAYFEPAASALVVGSLATEPMSELIERHRQDPVLDTIRTTGPAGLRRALERLPGFEAFPFRAHYRGICELCQDITRHPGAVAALRETLERPEAAAARLATWQVIDGNRRRGSLSFGHVNGLGACRLFLDALRHPDRPFDEEAGHLLGRADLDWKRLADYLAGSGLAGPLIPALDQPVLRRWAPEFFRSTLRSRGLAAALRTAVQRDVIDHIAAALEALGGVGILLKGGVHLVRPPRSLAPRATSDIDVLVDAALAPELHRALVARGFAQPAAASPGATHHLAPLVRQGVFVEIHVRAMEAHWGLPETAMCGDARPVDGYPALRTFGPEAFVLHAAVHASTSFFSFGLKTAWDVLAAQETGAAFDWDRLVRWAGLLTAPRAFWATLVPLAQGLDLGVPERVLQCAPADRGTRRAEFVARSRLFSAAEPMQELDAITKTAMLVMLHDGWWGGARMLATRFGAYARRPAAVTGMATRAGRTDVFRQAWRRYRQYRRAAVRRALVPDTGD